MDQKINLVKFWENNFRFSKAELKAFNSIKREDFIPKNLVNSAYKDTPLPLVRGKSISQPTTVMIMTSALELEAGDKVFEVGTGSGYQAAIISHIIGATGKIFTTEVVPELIQFAKNNFSSSNLKNINVTEEDGSKGMESEAPFDKIVITAACKEFPPNLISQLKEGGIIVGPVGDKDQQDMLKGRKYNNRLEFESLGPFIFTPMYGKYGFIN